MTFLSYYGSFHLLGGLATLIYAVWREYPEIKRNADRLAPLPRIIWNLVVMMICWPAFWMDR